MQLPGSARLPPGRSVTSILPSGRNASDQGEASLATDTWVNATTGDGRSGPQPVAITTIDATTTRLRRRFTRAL
jgi:hypothetical protein